jgi:hypothetical protein
MEQNHVDSGQHSTQLTSEEKRPGNDSRKRGPFGASAPAAQPEKAPSARQRWGEYRPTKNSVFWILLAAVALTTLVGFTWGEWMTSAGAQKMAATSATNAVIERLAPICVAQFNLDPDKDQKLKALQETSSYQRSKYVTDQTWATMAGDTQPDRNVADACAKLLMQIGQ